jgi:spore maturation protein CgeB
LTATGPRILVALMEDDYGDPRRGVSSELYSLLRPLQKAFPGTTNFDFMRRLRAVGKDAMQRELIALVSDMRPDVTLFNLYTDEVSPGTIAAIRPWTTTVAYFFDDIWQLRSTVRWARWFDFVTTSDPRGIERLAMHGVRNAIYSPFSFNEDVYVRRPAAKVHDVSFVGLYHPYREWLVRTLQRAGHRVSVFGHGWPAGRVNVERLVEVVNGSKVNLNLSNSSQWDLRFLLERPVALAWNIKLGKHHEQVKGRHFELAGCGGFQLSYEVDGLSDHFAIGKEIATYGGRSDLVAKVEHFLTHDAEREAIADAAWRRAQRDHTASARLRELIEEVLSRRAAPTRVSERIRP